MMNKIVAGLTFSVFTAISTASIAQDTLTAQQAMSDAVYLQCSADPVQCASVIQAQIDAYLVGGTLSQEEINQFVGQMANVALRIAAANPDVPGLRQSMSIAVTTLASYSTDTAQIAGLQRTASLIESGSAEMLTQAALQINSASKS